MHPNTMAMLVLIFLLTSLHRNVFEVLAQNCYYPNGDVSTTDGACPSNDGDGPCCPLNWACMSGGLCYYQPENYWGRYTCTDQTWQSSSCPQYCTHDLTAYGAEAILPCQNNEWCCDGNRVSGNCCTDGNTDFWNYKGGATLATVSSLQSPTPAPAASNSPSSSSGGSTQDSSSASSSPSASSEQSSTTSSDSSSASSTSSSSSSPPPPSLPSTVTHKSVSTGANGAITTMTMVTTALPASTGKNESQTSTGHSGSNLGLIVGLALGIPLALVLAGVTIWYFYRKHRKSKGSHVQRSRSPPMEANYSNISPGTHAPEIDSYPVAPTRSKSGRNSELYGSESFAPSPNLSIGSTPPQYSPGDKSPGGKSPGMEQIQEEPAELWGGYVPYRPSQAGPPVEENEKQD